MHVSLAEIQVACTTSFASTDTVLLNKHDVLAMRASSKCVFRAKNAGWLGRAGGVGRCAYAPNLGRSGKITLLERGIASLIIGRIGKKPQNSLPVASCYFMTAVSTSLSPEHGPVRRFATRVELPNAYYSTGLRCRDCGARRSNGARGQRASVVYARVAHGPSGGAPRPPSPPPSPPPPSFKSHLTPLSPLITSLYKGFMIAT